MRRSRCGERAARSSISAGVGEGSDVTLAARRDGAAPARRIRSAGSTGSPRSSASRARGCGARAQGAGFSNSEVSWIRDVLARWRALEPPLRAAISASAPDAHRAPVGGDSGAAARGGRDAAAAARFAAERGAGLPAPAPAVATRIAACSAPRSVIPWRSAISRSTATICAARAWPLVRRSAGRSIAPRMGARGSGAQHAREVARARARREVRRCPLLQGSPHGDPSGSASARRRRDSPRRTSRGSSGSGTSSRTHHAP